MNEQAQRIAIASVMIAKTDLCSCGLHWVQSDNVHCGNSVPDYLNDLNAMHEAEKLFSPLNRARYADILCAIITPQSEQEPGFANLAEKIAALCMATAAQRAEAFLRLIGKWE